MSDIKVLARRGVARAKQADDDTIIAAAGTGPSDVVLTRGQLDTLVAAGVIPKDTPPAQIQVFAAFCAQARLSPFKGQVHLVKRWSSAVGGFTYIKQTGIDGYRTIADRSGNYAPGPEPTYHYTTEGELVSATAYVQKWSHGTWHSVSATALYDEYVQLNKEGSPTAVWARMPHVMLAKCAEAAALRRAFPDELSGVYIEEELPSAPALEPSPQPRIELVPESEVSTAAAVVEEKIAEKAPPPPDPASLAQKTVDVYKKKLTEARTPNTVAAIRKGYKTLFDTGSITEEQFNGLESAAQQKLEALT